SPQTAEWRRKYQAHVAAVLRLGGFADFEAGANQVLSLETKIARAFAPAEDAADAFKQNNMWKRSDFAVKSPGMDWEAYLGSAGLGEQSEFVVWQPSAVAGISVLVDAVATDAWKNYLRFHLIEHYADVLPKAIRAEHTAFCALLAASPQPPDRNKAAITATNGALGQAVGQLYTQRYFPPEAKAAAE